MREEATLTEVEIPHRGRAPAETGPWKTSKCPAGNELCPKFIAGRTDCPDQASGKCKKWHPKIEGTFGICQHYSKPGGCNKEGCKFAHVAVGKETTEAMVRSIRGDQRRLSNGPRHYAISLKKGKNAQNTRNGRECPYKHN